MRNYLLPFLSVFLLSVGDCTAAPDGGLLFQEHCASCHGDDGDGGVGVPLSLDSFLDSVSDDYLFRTIRHGRPGRVMPAFQAMSDAQVNAVVGHMRSWSGKDDAPSAEPQVGETRVDEVITGDVSHGKVLFAKHCAQCHGEDARGGKGTGVTFSRKRNLPIIAPALNNSGFLASASDDMIFNTIMFGRAGTPMTSMLQAGLSEQDIKDLVVFIRSFEAVSKVTDEDGAPEEYDTAIIVDSPYGMDETIENLKQAITDNNFTLIRVETLDHGLVEPGEGNPSQMILHFCNFSMLFDALATDPRVGMFLPCRVTVIERDGKVQLSTINPKRLSSLFNNDELDETCEQMYQLYVTLLEDATL